jgi:photosystem II stability/assembly factor-like uncharacterized protein
MNRFERVQQILDDAVGGPAAPVGFHGAFWRGVTRNQFIAKKIIGLELIQLGAGASSNLVRALKGEAPFGADLPTPPDGATFNRMPSGRPPVTSSEIAFIETWINDGCPEDPLPGVAALVWRSTAAPDASSRTDDIWFITPEVGWAVNSDGKILRTADGGASWTVQLTAPGDYLRCVAFANSNVGWVGTLTRARRLYQTANGGGTWTPAAGLPVDAPVAVCGLSVVSDQVVFAAGSNRPTDSPRMMKTSDGGASWSAWSMSAHASILIDVYFTDAQHGWVVGGRADVPNPIDRSRVKPVVLRTADGGATWTDQLAGQEGNFPLGEWGWKIQFLNANVGFISLENFTAGAILRTDDGGATWRRLPINDPQGNANLEGVGFVDQNFGWVGGWGSADFSRGYSSVTTDGGQTWQNANDIGRFINRFRFFGNPVTVGYASGLTVYKYSADPVPVAAAGLVAAGPRPLLPQACISASALPFAIPLAVPLGIRRLTLQAWDRFGVDLGLILDEVNPQPGLRTFHWDPRDDQGRLLTSDDYIVRCIADDAVASSILNCQQPRGAGASAALNRADAGRQLAPWSAARRRTTSIAALMADFAPAQRDLAWLEDALQIAIQLELFTLPPYLTARWTIKNPGDPVAVSIHAVRGEEMLHFGLACNLLVAIGGAPLLADATVVPTYPGSPPGGVRPGLVVGLKRLSRDQAAVFMDIEYPQPGPIALAAAPTYNSIGEFYAGVLATFESLNPPLSTTRQLEGPLGLYKIDSLAKVKQAIDLINLQGEGTTLSPEEQPDDLAHYYRFAEIYHGKRLVKDVTGAWSFTGADVPLPDVWPMADVPPGGYQPADIPDVATRDLIATFDQHYSDMLGLLQSAWQHGDDSLLWEAITTMGSMGSTGRKIVQRPKPDGSGNYGPCFRYVP